MTPPPQAASPGAEPDPAPAALSSSASAGAEASLPREDQLRRALERHAASFEACFGAGERPRTFFSPGRVNLFGAHLDYNGGPVMPTAIDRGTYLALRPRTDRRVRMAAGRSEPPVEFELDALPERPAGRWYDYALGVLRALSGSDAANSDAANTDPAGAGSAPLGGFDVLFGGDLPIGAGLSSSASICVGFAYALDRLFELGLDPMRRIACALEAERGFVGVQCGIMDPFAVGLARPDHLLWLDCRDQSWEHVPLDFRRVAIGVADTGVRRQLAQGEFNRRVAECAAAYERLAPLQPGATCLAEVTAETLAAHANRLDEVQERRARHVVGEVERARLARAALARGDLRGMGRTMFETQASLRDDYEVSCPELDVLVDAAATTSAAFGGRLTGAGFGGCVVVLAEVERTDELRAVMSAAFERAFDRVPRIDFYGGDAGPREL